MQRLGDRKIQESGPIPHTHGKPRLSLPVLVLVVVAILGMLPSSLLTAKTARADTPGTLTIIVPNPDSTNTSRGPVGTNVTITGTGLTVNDTFNMGFATHDVGCTPGGFQAFGNVTAQTNASGDFAVTLVWPSSLAFVGTVYYICAEDASNSLVQSQTTFQVAGAESPAITIKAVAGPTPGAGTPSLPTSGFFPGSTVEIDGTNFLPGSTNLVAYLASSPVQTPADLGTAVQLASVGGQPIASTSGGQVTAMVQVPYATTPGSYTLYLVSQDSQADALPSLMASAPITVATAPSPTATATTAAVTPTSTPKNNTITPPAPSGPSPKRLAAIIGLASLSVILFIIGVILLASAAAIPRQG